MNSVILIIVRLDSQVFNFINFKLWRCFIIDLNININKKSVMPIYYQIREQIMEKIEQNILKPGYQLPSENELSKKLNVSRVTIRKAIQGLTTEGYCRKEVGKGIYVSEKKMSIEIADLQGATSFFSKHNKRVKTKLLTNEIINPKEEYIDKLQLSNKENKKVLTIERSRNIDDEPHMLDISFIPLYKFPRIEKKDFTQSFYEILAQDYNCYPKYSQGKLNILMATPEYAEVLQVKLDEPLMEKNAIVFNNSNIPIE